MEEKQKRCFKCGEVKPLSEFYKHPEMSDGRVNKCKECNKKDVNENRKLREEYYHAYDRNRPNKNERNKKGLERQRTIGKEGHLRANEIWAKNNKKKINAQKAVRCAVKSGKITKLPCFICGELEVEGHHPDYNSPLDVVWLCVKHHKEIHRKHDHKEDEKVLNDTTKGNRWDTEKEVR